MSANIFGSKVYKTEYGLPSFRILKKSKNTASGAKFQSVFLGPEFQNLAIVVLVEAYFVKGR